MNVIPLESTHHLMKLIGHIDNYLILIFESIYFELYPEVDKLVYSKQVSKWFPHPHEISKVFLFDLKKNSESELGDGHIAHGYWVAP